MANHDIEYAMHDNGETLYAIYISFAETRICI